LGGLHLPVATITPQALATQLEGGHAPLVLDVRSQAEFHQGHVPGAIHIPFWKVGTAGAQIPAAAADPVVVYCGHGPRAWIAGAALRRRGFGRLIYLAGHMAGWRKAGLPEEYGGK
jgi:rhodanese-related sulfurtransferase